MFDAWGISIFVGFDFHNADALRLKSRKELLTLLFRKLLLLRILVLACSSSAAIDVVQKELKELGLWTFAEGIMYVMKEVLGMPEEKMIVPMDEKRGKLLLVEILDGGNFGRHFSKYAGFTHQSMGKKYFLKIWRNMHFVRYYAEALCEPLFRTWHFFWRLKHRR